MRHLHFDLSIFDIVCGLSRQAGLCLIDEATARFQAPSAISRELRASPSVLGAHRSHLLATMARAQEIPPLRLIRLRGRFFRCQCCGSLCAMPRSRIRQSLWPTETNVCTAIVCRERPDSDFEQLPIGWPCPHLQVKLLDAIGAPTPVGEDRRDLRQRSGCDARLLGRPEASAAVRLAAAPTPIAPAGLCHDRGDGALMFGRAERISRLRCGASRRIAGARNRIECGIRK